MQNGPNIPIPLFHYGYKWDKNKSFTKNYRTTTFCTWTLLAVRTLTT
jgi:hypothetical protein